MCTKNNQRPGLNASDAELTYFFHPDHLGSASWITDLSGLPVQHLQYMPFGGDYIDQQDPNTEYSERFRFTGKERDAETGYDYFGARYYSSSLGIWLSVDPMSDKYPSLSPYVYCADNPMRLVDLEGMDVDEWEINNKGKIVNHIKTDKHDAFYMVDNNGNRMEGKEVVFDYGTIEDFKSQYSDQKKTTFDWFNVRGDDNGTQLFEFFAKNTTVEYGQLMLGEKGDNGLNIVSTSHESRKERSCIFLISKKYQYGYTIREHRHSHPGNTPYPSGLYDRTKDIGFANFLTDISHKNGSGVPIFKIYLPSSGRYVNYNKNSTIYDFPATTPESFKLPEVHILP